MMDSRAKAETIFRAGVESVLPDRLIAGAISLAGTCLKIGHLKFDTTILENLYVIGAGKASGLMAAEVDRIIGKLITDGLVVVKYGHSCRSKHLKIIEAGHPTPDAKGFKATKDILDIASKAGVNDLVICLLSGGGSALLADFPEGSTADEIMELNSLLVNSGATIREINAVRKHLSLVKGGQLARSVYPATIVSLILSDVPGDPLDVIASGPTSPDTSTFEMALEVVNRFKLSSTIPASLLKYLKDGASGDRPETPKPGDIVFKNTHNIIIGNNRLALESCSLKALELNINAVIVDSQLQGDTTSVAEYIVDKAISFRDDSNEIKPVCLLFGGETTVKMTGKGLGGRNQHLALLCVKKLRKNQGITILSAGTDGSDGPTDAAGAVVDSETIISAIHKKADPADYLDRFDSYHFFKKVGGLIKTGPTKTNVMDLIIVLISGNL